MGRGAGGGNRQGAGEEEMNVATATAVRGKLKPAAPLAPLVWFKSGGAAETLFEPADEADLVAYLVDLEQLPWRMYWGSVNLSAQTYPISRLTLTVYTLSLDKTWLSV